MFLQGIIETVDEFRLRRVIRYCDNLMKSNKFEYKTEILARTGIVLQYISKESRDNIIKIIEEYHKNIRT